GADLIRFAPDLGGTIALTGGQLSITDDLTVLGPGADRLAVSGNDASRVFRIDGGVSVAMLGLTVTHGLADNGGRLWDAGGDLTLIGVVVSDNQALAAPGSDASGGGVFNDGGTLTITFSTFTGNLVVGGRRLGPTTGGAGGGIANIDAALTVSHSTFSN